MDVLVTLGTTTALVYSILTTFLISGKSFYEAMSMITTFLLIGKPTVILRRIFVFLANLMSYGCKVHKNLVMKWISPVPHFFMCTFTGLGYTRARLDHSFLLHRSKFHKS